MYKYKLSFTTIIEQFKINGPLNTTEMKSPFESKYCSIANSLFNANVQYKLILKHILRQSKYLLPISSS